MTLTTVAPGVGGTGLTAPGANGNVLTSNGTAWVSQAASGGGGIPAGTVMIFGQTAAPTGFTKLTNFDNYALRVVSGTASTGGSVAFTTAFASGLSAGATTLSTSQIPSHQHQVAPDLNGLYAFNNIFGNFIGSTPCSLGTRNTSGTAGTGGGGSHTHTIPSLAVQYVDVIRATKD
jgi:hypothetical protein